MSRPTALLLTAAVLANLAAAAAPARAQPFQLSRFSDVLGACETLLDTSPRAARDPARPMAGRCLGFLDALREQVEWDRAPGEEIRFCLPASHEKIIAALQAYDAAHRTRFDLSWGQFVRDDAPKVFPCRRDQNGLIRGPLEP